MATNLLGRALVAASLAGSAMAIWLVLPLTAASAADIADSVAFARSPFPREGWFPSLACGVAVTHDVTAKIGASVVTLELGTTVVRAHPSNPYRFIAVTGWYSGELVLLDPEDLERCGPTAIAHVNGYLADVPQGPSNCTSHSRTLTDDYPYGQSMCWDAPPRGRRSAHRP